MGKLARTTQLDAAVMCAVWYRKTNVLNDFPAFLVFSIFYLEVGGGVAISLDF